MLSWTYAGPNPNGWLVQFTNDGGAHWIDFTTTAGTTFSVDPTFASVWSVTGVDALNNPVTPPSNIVDDT